MLHFKQFANGFPRREVNGRPRSVMRVRGAPCRINTSLKRTLPISVVSCVRSGKMSIQRVYESTTRSMSFYPSLVAGKGQMMSL